VRTPTPKPNKLHDELDALLDGRPVELTDELAPLVEAADALRAELATFQLDPEVADRHLERVLQRSGTVLELPVRRQPSGWDVRRRVVAVALAAALVLAPATMASAAALPGQAMYPFKRAIEEIRVASVQWSPAREAAERTRIADVRLGEVRSLTNLKMFNQLPSAIAALERAVLAARVAVAEAASQGEPVPAVAAKLDLLKSAGGQVVMGAAAAAEAAGGSVALSDDTFRAIQAAAQESQDVLPPPDRTPSEPTPTEVNPQPKEPENPSGPTSPDSQPTPSQPSNPPTDPSQSSNTTQTTQEPVTTTTAPEPESTTTTEPATPGSQEGVGGQGASPGKAPYEGGNTPSTTLPAP
jgi:outer membrane biosynthesis protein TonB